MLLDLSVLNLDCKVKKVLAVLAMSGALYNTCDRTEREMQVGSYHAEMPDLLHQYLFSLNEPVLRSC